VVNDGKSVLILLITYGVDNHVVFSVVDYTCKGMIKTSGIWLFLRQSW
jgi:hypothetical protein